MTTTTKLPARTSRRRQERDQRAERLARRLRREFPFLRDLPAAVVRSYAELSLLSRETLDRLKERGLVRADGTPDPFIETFRRLKLAELQYARLIGVGSATGDGKPVIDLETLRDDS